MGLEAQIFDRSDSYSIASKSILRRTRIPNLGAIRPKLWTIVLTRQKNAKVGLEAYPFDRPGSYSIAFESIPRRTCIPSLKTIGPKLASLSC